MSFQRKPEEEAVPIMLNWLTKTREGVVEKIIQSNSKESMEVQIRKIQHNLHVMEDLLPNLKHWQETFNTDFSALKQDMNDHIFDERSQVDKISDKFKSIDEKLKEMKKKFNRIKLPRIHKTSSTSQQLGFEPSEEHAQKFSEDIRMEENAVGLPATDDFEVRYNDLDPQLKHCLLCFSIFPENFVIKRRQLIYSWIGEGFINKSKDKTADVHTMIAFN